MQSEGKTRKRSFKLILWVLTAMQDLTLAVMVAILVLPVNGFGQSTPPREGDLDTTFGGDGFVFTDFGTRIDSAFAVAIQPDSKIVTGGMSVARKSVTPSTRIRDFALARYLSNGAADTTFGGDGKVRTDFASDDTFRAMALQPDGKILVAGVTFTASQRTSGILLRYLASGKLDTTFGDSGSVLIESGTADVVRGLALQPDGKILLAGRSNINDIGADFAVWRLHATGLFDAKFGANGLVTTDFGNDDASAIALQRDGKIIVTGQVQDPSGDNTDFAVVRYLPNGNLDSTFNGNGTIRTDLGGSELPHALVIQPDGRIVVAGVTSINRGSGFDRSSGFVARYRPSGRLDGSFGDAGSLLIETAISDETTAIGLQADGKIVVAGLSAGAAILARLRTDGTPDIDFGDGGFVRFTFPTGEPQSSFAQALAIQPSDGKLVIAGFNGGLQKSDFALARYHAITCKGVPVTRVGTAGNDNIVGTSGDDVIFAFGGNDFIDGRGGNDIICGGTGNDTLEGGGGDDILRGGPGTDICRGEGHLFGDKASDCETVSGVP
jgi:uncharacterized delta-60 repeat protein